MGSGYKLELAKGIDNMEEQKVKRRIVIGGKILLLLTGLIVGFSKALVLSDFTLFSKPPGSFWVALLASFFFLYMAMSLSLLLWVPRIF